MSAQVAPSAEVWIRYACAYACSQISRTRLMRLGARPGRSAATGCRGPPRWPSGCAACRRRALAARGRAARPRRPTTGRPLDSSTSAAASARHRDDQRHAQHRGHAGTERHRPGSDPHIPKLGRRTSAALAVPGNRARPPARWRPPRAGSTGRRRSRRSRIRRAGAVLGRPRSPHRPRRCSRPRRAPGRPASARRRSPAAATRDHHFIAADMRPIVTYPGKAARRTARARAG